ncbi:ribosome maturation factor RimP [Phaeacidiphilus oryzae]|uniref:ribosome maturation factor RimP n=1 Tax=Phaeacidiphilus oryzae TaxID=348818 RepID=UPI000565CAD7|nr:ribosome maturation factor RimP [Phaeacidiphilus oryzae]
MSNTQSDRLRALLEPLTAEAGLDLEEIQVSQAGKRRRLQVVVDGDEGVSLDTVAELSREFGKALDESDAMGDGEYVLEVGSPGVDRPLTRPRHWRRAVGRLVEARLADGVPGGEAVGRVLESDEAEDGGVLLEIPPVKGRGKPSERRLAYAEIARARVQVEFNRKEDKKSDASDEGDEKKEEA